LFTGIGQVPAEHHENAAKCFDGFARHDGGERLGNGLLR